MKRLLLISDTHGYTERITQVIRQAGEHDLLLHAGDHALDIIEHGHSKFATVCGNCDHPDAANVEQLIDIAGIRILLTHGHTLHVKTSPLSMMYRAAEHDADLTIFGHTHTPTLFVEEKRVFLNPGSLAYARGYTECTYAIAELVEGEKGTRAEFSFYTLGGSRIPAFDLVHQF